MNLEVRKRAPQKGTQQLQLSRDNTQMRFLRQRLFSPHWPLQLQATLQQSNRQENAETVFPTSASTTTSDASAIKQTGKRRDLFSHIGLYNYKRRFNNQTERKTQRLFFPHRPLQLQATLQQSNRQENAETGFPTSASTTTSDASTIKQTGKLGCTPMVKLERPRTYTERRTSRLLQSATRTPLWNGRALFTCNTHRVRRGTKGQLSCYASQSLNRIYFSFMLPAESLTYESGVPGENHRRRASANATY